MTGHIRSPRLILASLVLTSLISLSGCFQYPEGPIFTMQTKDERFEGTWAIDEVTDANGNNVTAEYSTYSLFVQVNRDNKYVSFFINNILDSYGTYSFAKYSDDLVIIYTTYGGVDVSKDVIQKFYTVRRLTDKWLYFIDDAGFEWHWKKD